MYSDSLSNSSSLITETNRAIFDAVAVGFGLHFHQQITENIFLNIGATYNLKTELTGDEEQLTTNTISLDNGITVQDTITNTILNSGTIILPQNYGIGASVLFKQKLELAVDYQTEKWSESKFFGENQNFYDNQRISAGLEFIPDFSSTKYLNIIRYRAGFNLTDSYLMVNDKRLKQIGASAGLGFPLRSGALINLGFIYTNKSIPGDDVLTEHNFQIHLNLSFKANWFVKRKFF
jgi:hypothetical protein